MNYSLTLILTFMLMMAIARVLGLNPGYASLLVLPLVVVATGEGRSYAREARMRPRNSLTCLACVKMMALAAVIAGVFFFLASQFVPSSIAYLGFYSFENLWLALAASAAVSLFVLRIGYAFGLASELKGQQLLAH